MELLQLDTRVMYPLIRSMDTMSYDVCMKALNVKASACSRGSEQEHEGFFYGIDPNEGACPPLTGKLLDTSA